MTTVDIQTTENTVTADPSENTVSVTETNHIVTLDSTTNIVEIMQTTNTVEAHPIQVTVTATPTINTVELSNNPIPIGTQNLFVQQIDPGSRAYNYLWFQLTPSNDPQTLWVFTP